MGVESEIERGRTFWFTLPLAVTKAQGGEPELFRDSTAHTYSHLEG